MQRLKKLNCYNFRLSNPFNIKSETFELNFQNHQNLNSLYRNLLQENLKYSLKIPRVDDKVKKLPARQRVELLLDKGSFFLELSQLAGYDLYDKDITKCGGIITGVGLIHNKPTMIIANDYSQKGGSYFPITVKKKIRAQEIAENLRLPCLYVADSAGANLPRQDEVFPDQKHFGRIFYNISRMSALGIPQISLVMGSCTAGGAYVPAMSDQSVIVQNQGTVFLAGPPLVKAATGEVISAEELGGGYTHTKISGVCDYLALDEFDAISKTRKIFETVDKKFEINFQSNDQNQKFHVKECERLFDPTLKETMDVKELVYRLTDGHQFEEFKENYGNSLITGYGNIYGQKIGFVANNGVLFSESALKASHFIQLCDQQNIPLLFLQNITGFMVGKSQEWGGIAKNGAKMVNAVANCKVPKITLVFGASYGAGNYGMCGRAYEPDFMYTWPMSKLSVMGGEQAAKVMTSIKKNLNAEEKKIYFEKLKKKYEKESEALYGTARLWDDGIILPEQTRQILGLSFQICKNKNLKINKENFGVFRM